MSVLLLKWQPTTDRYTVTLDAPDQALKRKRPSKERPQARGTLLYQEGIPESEETEKKGSQAQVAQEAPRIFAHQAPSARVGGSSERVYS